MTDTTRQEEFQSFLDEVKDWPYELYTWDCITFTNMAWLNLYGHYWSDEVLNVYQDINSPEDLGYKSAPEFLDATLPRGEGCGSLVALHNPGGPLGYALGINLGEQCVFVGLKGLMYLPTRLIRLSWNPNATAPV